MESTTVFSSRVRIFARIMSTPNKRTAVKTIIRSEHIPFYFTIRKYKFHKVDSIHKD